MSELSNLSNVLRQDLPRLKARLKGAQTISNQDKKQRVLEQINKDIERSVTLRKQKEASLPKIVYPEQLPVSQKHEQIKKAISENQAVIIAGETGSGKTTQIPKMCLELGRGIEGKIGHTQPRRLAARSVANRLCQELECEMGSAVGYKVRFNDKVNPHTYIKLMTDGVLLAEMQHDRYLNQYDTLIIDEAHERSLNIDFIIGYLKNLLAKRKDLKVIITSATIDPESFSKHFNNAPIIEVSGRTYPVEVRYRPVDELTNDTNADMGQGIVSAVDELFSEGRGDILLFLNGEREIRDTAELLNKQKWPNTDVLPLYSRLSAQEQNRIFAPSGNRRIVLSTNVAETSLTVPGIKYVIDTGTARISRYSYKSKVQRLPIEAISQASANQRMGRCGRTEAGICIRLYSEEDFLSRPEFTTPEILRTNLASVILQMLSLKLGDLAAFPFLQRPDERFINDGIRLLEELQAVTVNQKARHNHKYQLTKSGQQLSRIPVDPRLAKMVLAATHTNCLYEVIVLVAVLSIQDPRERPNEYQQKSDQLHARFKDKDSDFASLLNLWDYLVIQQKQNSNSQFRKMCKNEFINYLRIREWQDLVYQIEQSVHELGYKVPAYEAIEQPSLNEQHSELEDIQTGSRDYQNIHIPLLTGLLTHVGYKDNKGDKKRSKGVIPGYSGARNSEFHIFPGSGVFKTSAKWIVAAELVETSKLYGRHCAKIQPQWLESISQHLVNKSYAEPYWDAKQGTVMAFESQSLFGLPIVTRRRVDFANVDKSQSRQIFIQQALVEGEFGKKLSFLEHNQKIIHHIEQQENKARRRDLLVDDELLCQFYQQRIPENIVKRSELLKWLKSNDDKQLYASEADFSERSGSVLSKSAYPDVWRQQQLSLPVVYDFEPGKEFEDGVSVCIPLPLLNQVNDVGFDWQIPAFREELITAYIRSLPKQLRRNYVPAPEYAKAVMQRFESNGIDVEQPFAQELATALFRMTGSKVEASDWDTTKLANHLKINFRVVNDKQAIVAQGFDLLELKKQLKGQVQESIKSVAADDIEKASVTDWDFGDLPESYIKKQAGFEVKAYPSLVVKQGKFSVELLDDQAIANQKHKDAAVELIVKTLPSPIKHLQQKLPNKSKLVLYFNPFGRVEELIVDCVRAYIDETVSKQLPRTQAEFNSLREQLAGELNEQVLEITKKVEASLNTAHGIAKQLKGKMTFELIHAQAHIKAHLDSLIYRGFVYQTGVGRLDDLSRYLQALAKRLEKVKVDPNKDRAIQLELDKLESSHQQLKDKFKLHSVLPNEVEEIKWMMEELRVSLFAQTLKTKYPVSAKRVKQTISDIMKKA